MENLNFNITISARREKVWEILWSDVTYRIWSSVFMEGSHVVTSWRTGEKAVFMDSKNEGLISVIEEKKPNEFMSFKHQGVIKNGVEDYDSEDAREWAGAWESYSLTSAGAKTDLKIQLSFPGKYKDAFLSSWPQALEKIKNLAEKELIHQSKV